MINLFLIYQLKYFVVQITEKGKSKRRVSLNTFKNNIQPNNVAEDFKEIFVKMVHKNVKIPVGIELPEDLQHLIVFYNQNDLYDSEQVALHDACNPHFMDLNC